MGLLQITPGGWAGIVSCWTGATRLGWFCLCQLLLCPRWTLPCEQVVELFRQTDGGDSSVPTPTLPY